MSDESAAPDRDLYARFDDYYSTAAADVVREFEERVLGAPCGGNGYTDVTQARALIPLLDLRPGIRLLEVGAGAGWPGLLIAEESGCEVVFTDMPHTGITAAKAQADARSIEGTRFVASSGTDLPFRDRMFDAVSHSDVMC